MTSTSTGFNLLDEKWISVLDGSGREHAVSILETFDRATGLVEITGDVSTQSFSIFRVLLAFLHRAVDGPRDIAEWQRLWQAPELPMESIREYAARVRHRFDLFDPRTPFFQVAGLRTAKDEVSGLEKIVADVPNGVPFFTSRSARNLSRIDASEAARWLVHVHAFDASGIKSGAVGDPTVKNGRGYPIGTGWSGQLGAVIPQGRNLRETLLLNLVAFDAVNCARLGRANDVPPWERDPDRADCPPRLPAGSLTLYTWQSRRVRLIGDRDGVTAVVLANGDKLEPHNRNEFEPHTAWRYSDAQSKKAKSPVYMPLTHDPERAVWRGLNAFLPSISPRSGRDGRAQRLAPGVLEWIDGLVEDDLLPEDYRLGIRIQGVKYGSQSATIAELVDDVLPMSAVVLRADHPAAGTTATNAVADAEATANALWSLAQNIAVAGGGEAKSGHGDRARERFYAALDTPYRTWLSGLEPHTDLLGMRAEWQRLCRSHAQPVADELVAAASPAAWTGRRIGDRTLNVGIAEAWFRAALYRCLPFAFPDRPKPTTPEEEDA